MTATTQPINLVWWLVSRASGIVALVLITLSVLIGLTMAAKVLRAPRLKRMMVKLHEHVALAALLAIGAHGLSLLGDHWLKPGWRGITIPFALSYRPAFTGLGIIGGYLALLLGPSFYLRRRIGARRWRRLHTLILAAWLLSAVHTLGAGSDSHRAWLQALVLAPALPVVYLLALRMGRPRRREPASLPEHSGLSLPGLARAAALSAGAIAILLSAPAEAKGIRLHRADRPRQQLDRVMNRQRLTQHPQVSVDLSGTSWVGGGDRLGSGFQDALGLARAQLGGRLRL